MPILLQVNNLSKEYSSKKIFSDLSFNISNKQKIGIIGKNGAGKSTLFKIINGDEQADSGEIIIHSETNLGYLKQSENLEDKGSALNYLQQESQKPEWRVQQVASKFELTKEKLKQPASSLSGGWQMRLRLTNMLLKDPNLFLLDEPSNYLDLNTLILLENYLRSYRGSFLIISHDREFLKRTCQETIEISKTGCYHYPGNIEAYLSFKKQKLSTLIKANDSLARQQEHWQNFIDRFRYKASKAKQAQALIKKINKLEHKRINVEHEAGITRIIIPQVNKKKNFAIKLNSLVIGYNNQKLAAIDFDCRAGEKLAILGLNGQGKSTLIKTIVGKILPLSGSVQLASNSKVAYHSQEEIDSLPDQEQVGNFLSRLASAEIKNEVILKMAGEFLFKEDELKKSISVLSGGERSRLLLAALLLSKPDILILDEPTCHLDFETTEALALALQKFNGTILFASHDRTFTNLVATGLVEIKNGLGKRRYEDYSEYVNELEKELWQENKNSHHKENNKLLDQKKYLENKARQSKILSLERELEKMHLYKQEIMSYFLEHYNEYSPEKTQELEEIKRKINDKEDLWLELQNELQK